MLVETSKEDSLAAKLLFANSKRKVLKSKPGNLVSSHWS